MSELGCLRDANFQNIQANRIHAVDNLVFNNNIMRMDPNTNNLIVEVLFCRNFNNIAIIFENLSLPRQTMIHYCYESHVLIRDRFYHC